MLDKLPSFLQALHAPDRDLNAISDYMRAHTLFRRVAPLLNAKQQKLCWSNVQCSKMAKGETVFQKGAWPKDFYMILEGSVSILVPKDQDTMSKQRESNKVMAKEIESRIRQVQYMFGGRVDEPIVRTASLKPNEMRSIAKRLSLGSRSIVTRNENLMEFQIPELDNGLSVGDIVEPSVYFDGGIFKQRQVNKLGPGQHFGELGLILVQGRSATVLCLTDCYFATLQKEDFDKVLLEYLLNKQLIKVTNTHLGKAQMIQKAFGFNLSFQQMNALANCFHKVKLHLGTYLYIEGDQPMDTYVISKGETQLLKVSQEFEKQVQRLDLVQRVELLKSRQSLMQDPFMRLCRDVIRCRQIRKTCQNIRQQLKQGLAELGGQFRDMLIKQSVITDSQLKQKITKYSSITALAQKQTPNRVKTAGVLRSCVDDIDQFLQPREQRGTKSRIGERKKQDTYGPKIADKLRVMEKLINELPMPEGLDNDEYIQAFDKNGIERRMKKLRLRRKILNRNKRLSTFDEEQFKEKQSMLISNRLKLPSTRDRIKLKKMIESGEYRAQLNAKRKQSNLSWEEILSAKYREQSRYKVNHSYDNNASYELVELDHILHASKSDESNRFSTLQRLMPNRLVENYVKGPQLTPRDRINSKHQVSNTRLQTATSRRPFLLKTSQLQQEQTILTEQLTLTNRQPPTETHSKNPTPTSMLLSKRPLTSKRPQTALNNIYFSEQPIVIHPYFVKDRVAPNNKYSFQYHAQTPKQQSVQSQPRSKPMMQSPHNLYRFGSPQNVQEQILSRRNLKK